MVEDVEVPIEVWVFVTQRVEAVRAGGDDLALAFRNAFESVVQGLNVLLRHHLEQELVASAARGIAGAGLTSRKHAELHARRVQ